MNNKSNDSRNSISLKNYTLKNNDHSPSKKSSKNNSVYSDAFENSNQVNNLFESKKNSSILKNLFDSIKSSLNKSISHKNSKLNDSKDFNNSHLLLKNSQTNTNKYNTSNKDIFDSCIEEESSTINKNFGSYNHSKRNTIIKKMDINIIEKMNHINSSNINYKRHSYAPYYLTNNINSNFLAVKTCSSTNIDDDTNNFNNNSNKKENKNRLTMPSNKFLKVPVLKHPSISENPKSYRVPGINISNINMLINNQDEIKRRSRHPSNFSELPPILENNLNGKNENVILINNSYRSSALSEFDKGKESSDFSDINNNNIVNNLNVNNDNNDNNNNERKLSKCEYKIGIIKANSSKKNSMSSLKFEKSNKYLNIVIPKSKSSFSYTRNDDGYFSSNNYYISNNTNINNSLSTIQKNNNISINSYNNVNSNENNDNENIENQTSIDEKIYDNLADIEFEDIEEKEINLDFFIKSNIRNIPIKYKKNVKDKEKYLETVLELQNFYLKGERHPINVTKLSEDGKFFSVGCQNGNIIIYRIMGYDYENYKKIYRREEIISFLSFMEEEPYKELTGHSSDVIDLCWSPFLNNYLLSASLDHFVILWNVTDTENSFVEKWDHRDMVTCISFSPTDKYIFVSGCMDKFIIIWDISEGVNKKENDNNKKLINKNNEVFNTFKENLTKIKEIKTFDNESSAITLRNVGLKSYHNIPAIITAISFFPTGDKIAVGTHNGKIIVYEYLKELGELKLLAGINCRNRIGKNSLGKKITGIDFFNKNCAFISSCDSRIRYLNMDDGKLKYKYKGHEIENCRINCAIDHQNDKIISGSENGFCYVWNIDTQIKKNNYFECFKPFHKEIVKCVTVVPEKCYCNYIQKVLKLTANLFIRSIILITTNNGRIEVLLNIDDNVK